MTDNPGPIFTEEHVGTAVPAPEPLELREDDFRLTFSLDEGFTPDTQNTLVNLDFRWNFPDDGGYIEKHFTIGETDIERLYRLFLVSVLNQLRGEDEHYYEQLREAVRLRDLPKVDRLANVSFPEPRPDPLLLETIPRKKVLDWRGLSPEQQYDRRVKEHNTKEGKLPDWLYFAAAKVHRTDCPKAKNSLKSWNSDRDALNGRYAAWGDVIPLVRKGIMAPQACTKCNPLGKYTAALNGRIFYVNDTPPNDMPDELFGYQAPLTDAQKQGMWNRMAAMDLKKWAALADFIEWAAAETDDAPAAEYIDPVGRDA